MPIIQNVPLLTVYRNGLINLNGEATRLMHEQHEYADLLPPAGQYQPWRLDRRLGCLCKLVGRNDRGHLRFRAPYRVKALFAEQPETVTRIIFRITPHQEYLNLYTLAAELPISGKGPVVQQNPPAERAAG